MEFIKKYSKDFKLNWTLALPIIVSQLGQITVYLADNLMVGRLGAESLAAVSLAVAIIAAPTVLGMGISFALPTLVSEADGAQQPKKISQYFKHSFVINICFGIVAAILVSTSLSVLDYLGQDPGVLKLAKKYIFISAIGLIPIMIFMSFRGFSDGMSARNR